MEILKGLPVANAINEKLMEQVKSIEGPLPVSYTHLNIKQLYRIISTPGGIE